MKLFYQLICAIAIAGLLISCGKSGSSNVQSPDPATQPEAHAAIFQRSADRLKGLIEAKDYKQAQETLNAIKNYKLTPEQQKIVEQFQAQIPKNS